MGFSHHRRFLTRVGDDSHPLHLQLEGEGQSETIVDGSSDIHIPHPQSKRWDLKGNLIQTHRQRNL